MSTISMSLKINSDNLVTLDNKLLWDKTYHSLPLSLQDVYYTSEYYSIYEKTSGSKAVCFVFNDEKSIFLYPFLLSEIDRKFTDLEEKYYDIEGAYGYNGPLVYNGNSNFVEKANRLFCEVCERNNIVAEFTRFNPVLKNHTFTNYMKIIHANNNIVLDLNISDIWKDAYEHSTRKNINKAERFGLKNYYVTGQNISEEEIIFFLDIYYNTMKRNNAQEQYYFSETYFKNIKNSIPNNTLFFFTVYENKIISCELVLTGSKIGYSFLGGTLPDYFSMRANDTLKNKIITTLKELGFNYFCLGGGTTLDDGIYKYKKCFAKNGSVDFFIGKKIHNQTIYDKVIGKWQLLYPVKEEIYKHYLLKYKY